MKTRAFIAASAAILALSACGGGGAGGAQGEVADMFDDLASEEGIEFDRGCVEDLAGELSDDDAEAIVEAGTESDPDISPEGEAIGQRVFEECVDIASYRDALLESFEDDDTIDVDCLRDALGDASSVSELEESIMSVALDCASLGG